MHVCPLLNSSKAMHLFKYDIFKTYEFWNCISWLMIFWEIGIYINCATTFIKTCYFKVIWDYFFLEIWKSKHLVLTKENCNAIVSNTLYNAFKIILHEKDVARMIVSQFMCGGQIKRFNETSLLNGSTDFCFKLNTSNWSYMRIIML